jgi:hypothetical protein
MKTSLCVAPTYLNVTKSSNPSILNLISHVMVQSLHHRASFIFNMVCGEPVIFVLMILA